MASHLGHLQNPFSRSPNQSKSDFGKIPKNPYGFSSRFAIGAATEALQKSDPDGEFEAPKPNQKFKLAIVFGLWEQENEMEKTERKPNSPQMDLHLLPPSPPPERRRRSTRANRFSGSYYYGKQQMNRRPDGKAAAAEESPFSTYKFKNTSSSGKPSPRGKQKMNRRRDGKAAAAEESPFSTSNLKNTSTSGKPSTRDEFEMALRHFFPPLEPRPHLNLRRSERSTKFSGRYGYSCEYRVPPLHPKLKRFFFITELECKEFMKDAPPAPPAGPYDGFGFSADEIARLEAMRRNEPVKPPEGLIPYVDTDKLVEKYTAEGLSKEVVMAALLIHVHNPTKIPRFVNGYTRLLEMGFPPDKVVDALEEYDDDAEKALDYLNNSDKLVEKYTAEGLSKVDVMAAVRIHFNNPTKIPGFVNGYTRLLEMGFQWREVVNALKKYDDDAEKALDYLNNSDNNATISSHSHIFEFGNVI